MHGDLKPCTMPPLYRSPLALPFPLTLQKQLGCWASSPAVSACEPAQPAAAPVTYCSLPSTRRASPPSSLDQIQAPFPPCAPPANHSTDSCSSWQLPRPLEAPSLRLPSRQPPEHHPRLQSHLVPLRLPGTLTGPCGRNLEDLYTLSTKYFSPHKKAHTHTHISIC